MISYLSRHCLVGRSQVHLPLIAITVVDLPPLSNTVQTVTSLLYQSHLYSTSSLQFLYCCCSNCPRLLGATMPAKSTFLATLQPQITELSTINLIRSWKPAASPTRQELNLYKQLLGLNRKSINSIWDLWAPLNWLLTSLPNKRLKAACQDSALFHRAKTTKKVRVINDVDHRE
jgi:hypothetical protein